jgi:hypothetical protein
MSALLGEGRGAANGAGDASGRTAAPLIASAANAAAASSSSSSLVSNLSTFGVIDSGHFGGGSGTSESAAAEVARFEAQTRAIDAAAAARRASVPEPRAAAAHVSIGVFFWGDVY